MKVKVACCWDDGVYTDLKLIELLKKYHAKATFNLSPGWMEEHTVLPRWRGYDEMPYNGSLFVPGRIGLAEMREVYQDFQVASHCWNHELAMEPGFIDGAVKARKYLEELFQRPCTGFAWPCGRVTPEAIAQLRENGFEYGRTTDYSDDVCKCAEPLAFNSSCHFQDRHFYKKFQAAKEQSGVFYFWGHSFETLDFERHWQDLEFKLRFISEDPDAEWVDVIDLARMCHA